MMRGGNSSGLVPESNEHQMRVEMILTDNHGLSSAYNFFWQKEVRSFFSLVKLINDL